MDVVGTTHGVDHARELNESAVSCILDDTSVMLSDFGIEKRLSKSSQLRHRAFFIDPYQAARARDIRRQNSRQSSLYLLAGQDAPRARGNWMFTYSTIVGRCPARPHVRSGSWPCKNIPPREVGEKPGPARSQATIAAISGLLPSMFMTRVRL
jgi:hypothetical protein